MESVSTVGGFISEYSFFISKCTLKYIYISLNIFFINNKMYITIIKNILNSRYIKIQRIV